MGKGLLTELEKISQGFEEYSQLKNLKRPLKLSFSLVLGLLSLVVIFGSVWVAFRLSRQLTEPILALSRGTVKLARGEPGRPRTGFRQGRTRTAGHLIQQNGAGRQGKPGTSDEP